MSSRHPRTPKSTSQAHPLRRRASDPQEVNRNAGHKSLATDAEDDESVLLHELEHGSLTAEQLWRLKHSPKLDPARYPQERLDQMRVDVLQATHKPHVFEERRHFRLDADRLYRQLARHRPPRDLLHNFKRQSASHRALFEWAPLSIVRDLMEAVHHHIFTKGSRSNLPAAVDSGSKTHLQNALIKSYSTPHTACGCAQFVYRLEVMLNAALRQAFIRGARALFVMDWSEAPQFSVVFALQLTEPADKKKLAEQETKKQQKQKKKTKSMEVEGERTLEFTRLDLFDAMKIDETQGEQAQSRALLRDGYPSYVYYAFFRRDESENELL